MQGNLARPAAVAKAFASDAGGFELVFNCAALTKFGQVTPAWPPFDPHTPALPHALAHTTYLHYGQGVLLAPELPLGQRKVQG